MIPSFFLTIKYKFGMINNALGILFINCEYIESRKAINRMLLWQGKSKYINAGII